MYRWPYLFGVLLLLVSEKVHADFSLTQIEPSDSLAPFIIGGTPVDPKLWPATLIFDSPAYCTATVVGPQAILTAAHCLNGASSGSALIGGKSIPLTCTENPSYSNDTTADVAMCAASAAINAPGLKYEVLNLDSSLIKVKNDVVLLGFGCTVDGGKDFGVLYVGRATVQRVPVKFQRYEVMGGAKLCEGDSGGAGYHILDKSKRVVFGVNESQVPGTNTSYLSSVTTSDNMTFITGWSSTTGHKVCGMAAGLAGCRH
jgi:hypothetical protein